MWYTAPAYILHVCLITSGTDFNADFEIKKYEKEYSGDSNRVLVTVFNSERKTSNDEGLSIKLWAVSCKLFSVL